MPTWVPELYRDPRFLWIALGGTAVSMGAFALFAAPLTLLAWRDPPSLRKYRIQRDGPAREQKLVGPSITRWLVNNLAMLATVTLGWPLLSRSAIHLGDAPPWWLVACEVTLFVYLDDFLFYWMHRALHTPWLFRHVHAVHHRIRTPWAVTGHYSHPAEYVATGLLALAGPALVGAHVYALWAWVAVRQWEAAEGHCGYDFPWSPSHLLPGSDGARHHDAHHAKVHGNFAGFLAHVDGWFGTYSKGYAPWRSSPRDRS